MELQDPGDSDDPRDIELSSLLAIFPEIQVDQTDPRTFSLELPVNPSKPIQVFFPGPAPTPAVALGASAGGSQQPGEPDHGQHDEATATAPTGGAALEDSHELAYLPSVRLHIVLPQGYPSEKAPQVNLSTAPSWIPSDRVKQLEAECEHLWEELSRDVIVFTYIDYIQQAAEDAFGVVDERGALKVDTQHKIAILDYDISARRAAFERETFDCGVCLDPKKGSACHRMSDCGHVFCVGCLQDFYNNAIKEGDISSVRCLAPNCAKEREEAGAGGAKRKRKPMLINPSELLQIPLDHDMVKRYVTLKYKNELESDKNTIYCPRPWCNGAARSKKHKKPEGLEFAQGLDDDESENEDAEGVNGPEPKETRKYDKTRDLLSICEDCGFAFCSRCFLSWHGEFIRCTPKRTKEELTAEEKASLEYLELHTTPCPTCGSPAQKTHGCNHMICGRQGCETHFCYLCSAWLDPDNPYSHYNQQATVPRITGCFGRLWELEEGDGDDVGLGFAGGAQPRPARQRNDGDVQELLDVGLMVPEIEELEVEDAPDPAVRGAAGRGDEAGDRGGDGQQHQDVGQGVVALEAPLVLRIAADHPPGHAAPPPVPVPPPAPERARGRQRNQNPGRNNAPPQRGQRGRGARGGARGLDHQQQQQNNQARNNIGGRGRGGRGRAGAAVGAQRADHNNVGAADDLNEAQRAWVRQFVQLALDDEEDQVDSDSDDGEEEMVFWIR